MKKSKAILIVEDEKPLLNALNAKLSNEGFSTLLAENGKIGLDMAFKDQPDLILLDIIMPVLDGMDMLKRLRKDEWGKKVPVLLLTNVYEIDKMSEAMKLGISGYLVKADWKLEEVVTKIGQILKM